MAAPKVQSLDKILAQLDPAYAPSRQLYNQQIGTLPGQEQQAVSGLDAAKQNSFRDINTGANSKGLAFSGIPEAEQARYLGEKYLPAVAGIKQNTQTQQFTLQQALASLASEQRLKGLDVRTGQQKTLDDYLESERQRQFTARQNALDRQATAANAAADRAASASDTTSLTLKKNKGGGYTVLENGKASKTYDLNAYARATGANIVDLLANGDARDRQAAKWYYDKIKKYGNADQAKYLDELKRDRGTAFYLGG